jgi:hypothetical protein
MTLLAHADDGGCIYRGPGGSGWAAIVGSGAPGPQRSWLPEYWAVVGAQRPEHGSGAFGDAASEDRVVGDLVAADNAKHIRG